MITRKAVAVASQEAAAFCSQQATARRALTSEQPAIVELMPQPAYFGKPLTILYRGEDYFQLRCSCGVARLPYHMAWPWL